jgi:CO/xanthine dehydrogenase FAD-binding subunit
MPISVIPNFEYHVPANLQEALELLDKYGASAKVIAGGTDLIPKMKGGACAPEHVISLKKLGELKYINYCEKSGLAIGATTIIREVEINNIVREKYNALYQGIHCIASTQIRNAATITGNICNAVPSADSAPAALVLGAKLKIQSVNGERIVPIEEFFTGVCKTVLQPNELVTELQYPNPAAGSNSIYCKYSIRNALDLAMVGVAASVTMDGDVCTDAKIGLGAVAITPKRAYQAEDAIIGQVLNDELIKKAALLASQNDCCPISDIRASCEYRNEMVRLLTRDALKKASGC